MTDLPPQLLAELFAALVGVLGGIALVLRLVPAGAAAMGRLLDRWLGVLEQWSATNAATAKAMTDRALVAEMELQGLRRELADTKRMLAAEVERNNALQVQDASSHQPRGKT